MSDKILTGESESAPKPKTLTLAEGVTAHVLIQYDQKKGVCVSVEGQIPTPLLYLHLQMMQEKLMAAVLIAEQRQAQEEAMRRVTPARGVPRSPFGG